ncbi:MAG: hypothetical protein Ta2B_15340 [Termitinemataceae bacterium]|nr:MAG: hypothetical protein Ta2B_15340 [Termitinemataceae bacterium]
METKRKWSKMLMLCVSAMVLAFGSLFVGCTSVPHVGRVNPTGTGKYDVVVNPYYGEEELKYAFNSFAKKIDATSYSVEQSGENQYRITTPGDQKVEDLKKVKHFNIGGTVGLAAGIGGGLGLGLVLIILIPLLL